MKSYNKVTSIKNRKKVFLKKFVPRDSVTVKYKGRQFYHFEAVGKKSDKITVCSIFKHDFYFISLIFFKYNIMFKHSSIFWQIQTHPIWVQTNPSGSSKSRQINFVLLKTAISGFPFNKKSIDDLRIDVYKQFFLQSFEMRVFAVFLKSCLYVSRCLVQYEPFSHVLEIDLHN